MISTANVVLQVSLRWMDIDIIHALLASNRGSLTLERLGIEITKVRGLLTISRLLRSEVKASFFKGKVKNEQDSIAQVVCVDTNSKAIVIPFPFEACK